MYQARGDVIIFVLERQRGYLREHLHDPLAALITDLGWTLVSMSPSEKFHHLGVTSDKTESVSCAARHFRGSQLHTFLTAGPVSEVHDVADVALFAVMAMDLKCEYSSTHYSH
jgi:hypothetical protein